MQLSIAAEGVFGLSWPAWQGLVRDVERLGFTGLYLADHLVLPEPPDYPSLDVIVALTWLASHSERLVFGPRVAPLSMRDPVHLARQAANLQALSNGRFVLGVGAGWMEREHEMFGFALGTVSERMDRLEEGIAVLSGLLRSDDPVTRIGGYFQLRDAKLPGIKPATSPPILIGSSGVKRGLPMVARYADIWNAQLLTPDEVRERSELLDALLADEGRSPETVRRTLNAPIVCGRTPEEIEARLQGFRRSGAWADISQDKILAQLREWFVPLVGTPAEIVAQIKAYEAAGISEISLQWFDTTDLEGLHVVAEEVLPHVS